MALATVDAPQPARPVLSAVGVAEEALAGAETAKLWALSEPEVEQAMEGLSRIHAMVQADLVAVVAEARSRGLGCDQGWGSHDWVRLHGPGLATRTVADLDVVAGALSEPRLAELSDAVAQGASPAAGDALELGRAAQVVRFHEKVRGLAEAEQLDDITHTMVASSRGPGGLTEGELAILIRHTGDLLRPDRLAERDEDVRRAHRSLVKSQGPAGMWRYSMLLDDEGAEIVDAAVDALAKPVPDPEGGERDRRSAATRRADAVVELVRRAVGAPDGVPRQAKTTVVVKIGLGELQRRCRGAGITMGDKLLSVETVRRLACDAQVLPVVLGSNGEVLEQGHGERLFTGAQIRHLWLRDKHCTFPGCTKPATWTDAHHLIHWADGGPTDVGWAALLCQKHHTTVHSNRYAGEVVDRGHGPRVVWDLTPGSYEGLLARWRRNQATAAGMAAAAPGLARATGSGGAPGAATMGAGGCDASSADPPDRG
jgi:hypothetical protein